MDSAHLPGKTSQPPTYLRHPNTALCAPPCRAPHCPPATMLDKLPEDIQIHLLSLLCQREISHLAISCKSLNRLAEPLLRRVFRCCSCSEHLLHPRNLLSSSSSSTTTNTDFLELRHDADHNFKVDSRRGAANFHVLRHLRQTLFRNVRFPVAQELQAVRALRCPHCDVFVGFRHDGMSGVAREYLHLAFVELVDGSGQVVSLNDGSVLHSGTESITVSRCAHRDCNAQLFEADDILPWSHVLASSRLTDMNAYLEWDHSWTGAASASQPAFFVKRLKRESYALRNVRVEHIRQGCMQVGDVLCNKCQSHIGWKLLAEVPASTDELLHNYDQIGRFGIIRNAVTPSQPLRNVIL